MDAQERNFIAYTLLKLVIKEETRLSNISDLKRKAGNLQKQTGIPAEKIVEFGKIVIREAFEEQMAAIDKPKREDKK
jgi:hypothetical protein